MIDRAAGRWPDTRDRKALLLRLAEAGAAQIGDEAASAEAQERRARQVAAARESAARIDVERLLSDDAWT